MTIAQIVICSTLFKSFFLRFYSHLRIPNVVLNIDLAPTFLDMGGVEIPPEMDGKSILPILDRYVSGKSRGIIDHGYADVRF
jgi:hypothetical protein